MALRSQFSLANLCFLRIQTWLSSCQAESLCGPQVFIHLLVVTSLNPHCSLILLGSVGRFYFTLQQELLHIVALIESQFHGIKLVRDELEILLNESSVDRLCFLSRFYRLHIAHTSFPVTGVPCMYFRRLYSPSH